MAKKSLKNQLVCIAGAFAAEVTFEGDYPAWEYKKDSKLREDMVRILEEMYGKKPTVEAIHAGVECGLLSGKIEGLDCISMGPDMYDIHTTEAVSYTHLDVYKRQVLIPCLNCFIRITFLL